MTEMYTSTESAPANEEIEAFIVGAADGNCAALGRFLQKWPGHVDMPNGHSWTALMQAAWSGQDAAVNFLLNNGANRNLLDKWGRTPWVLARKQGHRNVMAIIHPPNITEVKAQLDIE